MTWLQKSVRQLFVAPVLVAVGLGAATLPTNCEAAPTGEQGGDWASIGKLPNWQGLWEMDWEHNPQLLGLAPTALTPVYQTQLEAFQQAQKKGENAQTQDANCLTPGMPRIMTMPYPIEFLFDPGKVVLVTETMSQVRHIYTDGEAHPADPDPSYLGNSIGHWEGDTLVVDTVAFDPSTEISPGIPHSDQMRVVERIRKLDPNRMQIERTISDPKVLAKPWKVVLPFVRVKDHMREYVCEQNNRDSADSQGRAGLRIER
ncbi:MAG TPA: hypothetical protein VGM84_13210 [Steroidobacteraceae bacterium]|jgi:hypothetical protein